MDATHHMLAASGSEYDAAAMASAIDAAVGLGSGLRVRTARITADAVAALVAAVAGGRIALARLETLPLSEPDCPGEFCGVLYRHTVRGAPVVFVSVEKCYFRATRLIDEMRATHTPIVVLISPADTSGAHSPMAAAAIARDRSPAAAALKGACEVYFAPVPLLSTEVYEQSPGSPSLAVGAAGWGAAVLPLDWAGVHEDLAVWKDMGDARFVCFEATQDKQSVNRVVLGATEWAARGRDNPMHIAVAQMEVSDREATVLGQAVGDAAKAGARVRLEFRGCLLGAGALRAVHDEWARRAAARAAPPPVDLLMLNSRSDGGTATIGGRVRAEDTAGVLLAGARMDYGDCDSGSRWMHVYRLAAPEPPTRHAMDPAVVAAMRAGRGRIPARGAADPVAVAYMRAQAWAGPQRDGESHESHLQRMCAGYPGMFKAAMYAGVQAKRQ